MNMFIDKLKVNVTPLKPTQYVMKLWKHLPIMKGYQMYKLIEGLLLVMEINITNHGFKEFACLYLLYFQALQALEHCVFLFRRLSKFK